MIDKGPNCYECKHIIPTQVPYNCHMACTNHEAKVERNPHGINNGGFIWPMCYDPIWLVSCDGFMKKAAI